MAPPSTYPLSLHDALPISVDDLEYVAGQIERMTADERDLRDRKVRGGAPFAPVIEGLKDRKSTRLNSSHVAISYAVFCLKKKKSKPVDITRTADIVALYSV